MTTVDDGVKLPTTGQRAVDSPRVWTTLLTNTKYLSGLLTLDYTLKKVGSKYPLVVLYTDALEPEGHKALEERGIPKQRIEYLLPKLHKDYGVEVRFYDCWSKLAPFSLVQYERVVQLDSDMLVLKNLDELMEMELDIEGDKVFAASHACVCNPLKKPHYPKDWIPINCGFTSQHDPDEAQVTGASIYYGLGIMNGGLQVVNPSAKLYKQISDALENGEKTTNYEFADQSLLSDVFKGRWHPIPYIYNALKTLRWCHEPIWRDDEVKICHYILSPKPWDTRDCSEKDEVTHSWWWRDNDARQAHEISQGILDGW